MSLWMFLKLSLGFLVGAALGVGVAVLGLRIVSDRQPTPPGQISDLGVLVVYILGVIVVTVVLALVGGIAGVVVMKRFS